LAEFHLNPKAKCGPFLVDRRIVNLGLPKSVSNVPRSRLRAASPTTRLITKKRATPMAIKLVDTKKLLIMPLMSHKKIQ